MKKKVVVENTLGDVKNYLGQQGYDVRTMYRNDTLGAITSNEYQAIVVENMNNAAQNPSTSSPVIEAGSLTPEQVYEKINNLQ